MGFLLFSSKQKYEILLQLVKSVSKKMRFGVKVLTIRSFLMLRI